MPTTFAKKPILAKLLEGCANETDDVQAQKKAALDTYNFVMELTQKRKRDAADEQEKVTPLSVGQMIAVISCGIDIGSGNFPGAYHELVEYVVDAKIDVKMESEPSLDWHQTLMFRLLLQEFLYAVGVKRP